MNGGAERVIRDGDIVVREQGALRRITLNRPKALNALTLDMAATILAQLRACQDDAAVGAVLIDGAGERGTVRRRRSARTLRCGEVRR